MIVKGYRNDQSQDVKVIGERYLEVIIDLGLKNGWAFSWQVES